MAKKAAYFEMSVVGHVGSIFTRDGNETQPLITKKQALTIGEALIGISITEKEWETVKEEILASPLIDDDPALEAWANEFSGHVSEQIRNGTFKKMLENFLENNS